MEGVRRRVPPGTEALNQRALEAGATLIRKIPEVEPEKGELEAIAEADADILLNGTIAHDAIQW